MPLIKPKHKKAEMEAPEGAKSFAMAYATKRSAHKGTYAKMPEADSPSGSVADSIMKRRKMADGGMVDDDNMETPARMSPYDEDNVEATLKEIYDGSDDQIGPEPMDSDGDPEEKDEEDQHDMISTIRRKMRR